MQIMLISPDRIRMIRRFKATAASASNKILPTFKENGAYFKHWSPSTVSKLLERNDLVQGRIKVYTSDRAAIRHPKNDSDVFIYKQHINRAFPDDLVAAYIYPLRYWRVIEPGVNPYVSFTTVEKCMSRFPALRKIRETELNSNTDPYWIEAPVNLQKNSLLPKDVLNTPFGVNIQRTGCVVSVLSPASRTVHGRLKPHPTSKNMFIFTPFKRTFPMALIRRDDLMTSMRGNNMNEEELLASNYLVTYSDWNAYESMPFGQIYSVGADSQDLEQAAQVLLISHALNHGEFPDEVLQEAASLIPRSFIKKQVLPREDFTNACVFSIDPSTAKDLDDAVHIKQVSKNSFEVGVHIADVSHYVDEATEIDNEAARRATTVYMVHRVLPMLPPVLSEHLCSLNPGETKLTFSVIFEIDRSGQVLKTRFTKSLIRSCIKLAYEEANSLIRGVPLSELSMLETKVQKPFNLKVIQENLQKLNSITRQLRQARFNRGALNSNKPKLKFILKPRSDIATSPPAPVRFPVKDEVEEEAAEEDETEEEVKPTRSGVFQSLREKLKNTWQSVLDLAGGSSRSSTKRKSKVYATTAPVAPPPPQERKPPSSAPEHRVGPMWPVGWTTSGRAEADFLIEELMLLANQAVASFLFENWEKANTKFDTFSEKGRKSAHSMMMDALLRRHPPPLPENSRILALRCSESKVMQKIPKNFSLQQAAKTVAELEQARPTSFRGLTDAFTFMCFLMMRPAEYFSNHSAWNTLVNESKQQAQGAKSPDASTGLEVRREDPLQKLRNYAQHFGLQIPLYTHFTSPIRRYADILVHRQVYALLLRKNIQETEAQSKRRSQSREVVRKPVVTSEQLAAMRQSLANMQAAMDPVRVMQQSIVCNTKHLMHRRVGERCQELFLAAFIRLSGPIIERGAILSISTQHVRLNFPRLGLLSSVLFEKVVDKAGNAPFTIRPIATGGGRMSTNERQRFGCEAVYLMWPFLDKATLTANSTMTTSATADEDTESRDDAEDVSGEEESVPADIFPPIHAPSLDCECLYSRLRQRLSVLDFLWCQISCKPDELSLRVTPCRPRCGKCRQQQSSSK